MTDDVNKALIMFFHWIIIIATVMTNISFSTLAGHQVQKIGLTDVGMVWFHTFQLFMK